MSELSELKERRAALLKAINRIENPSCRNQPPFSTSRNSREKIMSL